jgi:hypothetical protein
MDINAVKVKDLQIEHFEYQKLAPQWRTIQTLKDGYDAIESNLAKYLPRRPDEDEELWSMRMAKFSYTPVMSDAVSKYANKLAGSPVHLSNAENDFWSTFRVSNNHPDENKRNEANLLNLLFSRLIYYSRTWVVVDRPKVGLKPRSKYESDKLQNKPYVVILDPLDVIYWDTDWAVTRTYFSQSEPFQAPKMICRWTLYTKVSNIVYEAEVKLKTSKDYKDNLYDEIKLVRIGNDWVSPEDDKCILQPEPTKSIQHNLGMRMITTLSIPSEKWIGKMVANKQIQHLRIENAWTDAGYLSGVVQRVFTPPDAPPIEDPRQSYEQPDYAEELKHAGNAHILIGKQYAFVESQGTALANLQMQLDKIESQIKVLVSLHFASSDKGALEQSGLSKGMDMSLLQDSMKEYGQQVLSLYNSILSMVSKQMGLLEPVATGLSSYSIDVIGDLIEQLQAIEELPKVPKTAKKIAYGKLSQLLTGTTSPEDEEVIKAELKQLFNPQ